MFHVKRFGFIEMVVCGGLIDGYLVSRETWRVAVGVVKRGAVFHVKRLVGVQCGSGFT